MIGNGNGNGKLTKELLRKVDEQMQMLNSVACVPAYYRHKLMAILLLGEKRTAPGSSRRSWIFFAALASDAAMAIRNAQLFEDLKREADRNRALFLQTIEVLGSTIEAKDAYTHGTYGTRHGIFGWPSPATWPRAVPPSSRKVF